MSRPNLKLLLLGSSLALVAAPVFAQVDSIPDPHQDFYEEAKPKRAPDLKNQSTPSVKAQGNDLDDAMSVPDDGPKPAPDRNGAQPIDPAAQPTAPAVTHPELMPRPPIPTPPAMSLLRPINGGQLKDTLSWRTRAYKMRAESSETRNGLVKGSRLVNASFDDTISAVTAACSAKGLVIDSIFESAGQVLAHPNDSGAERSRIIISVKPVTKTSTLIRIGLDADNRLKQASFDDLFNRIDTAVNEKGLL
ncbi:hypothetical protein BH10CYA1_BH10CYA1_28200 [soil metagenome]